MGGRLAARKEQDEDRDTTPYGELLICEFSNLALIPPYFLISVGFRNRAEYALG